MKIPQKFMGLLGKFADSLDYKDLPKGWADNPEIVQAAGELYRDMGTESPFFKAWFGKSKVVDEAGKPLKAYHGTNAKFDTFRNSKSGTFGPASYFTPDKDIALQYANGHDGSNLKEVFLKSDNPYSIQDTTQAPEKFWDVFDAGNDEKTINNFLAHGYDSAWAKGKAKTAFGETSPEIAVYSPEKIKSTSNRGTFNPSDPNIYRALPWAAGGAAAGAAMMPDEAQAASFTGFKNLGENVLDYMMKHRPWPDEEMSAGLHDMDTLFPGIYGNKAVRYRNSNPKVTDQAMNVINAVRDNPDALVDVYRAVPKGVRDFNTGDWVSISKEYAKEHGENVLRGDYDLIKAKAKASDIYSPGDSIAEEGYWGEPVLGKITKGILPIIAAGGATAAFSPSSAQASIPADEYPWPAKQPGYVNREPGLEAPVVDPVDIMTAPIGAATAGGKVAAMAAEPFLAYGMDKAGNWLGNRIGGLLGYFGWGD